MDKAIAILASWEAALLAFATFALISMAKRLGTTVIVDGDNKIVKGWAQSVPFKILLPLLPYIIVGGLICIPGAPLPALVESLMTKVLFAFWCGWLSDKSFEITKRVLEKGFGVTFEANK